MSDENALNFVLCWHMHQPWYQQGVNGEYRLPWVYLHAIKDYEDMVSHLETHRNMHVVVNFAPILLEQIDDYAQQIKAWLDYGQAMKDPILNLLAGAVLIPDDIEQRRQLLANCRRANGEKMIEPYPVFKALLDYCEDEGSESNSIEPTDESAPQKICLQYLNKQFFIDVLVWYHLVWLGHTLKQTKTFERLMKKAAMFDDSDRRELMQLIYECLANLIPRYRALAHNGQIELSMSPYCHPIIPLLNNMDNMQCAQPEAPSPECDNYPGGYERSRWHIQKGIDCFQHYFGLRPQGIWLSEGAISEDSVSLVEEFDFSWTASGEGVWQNSMNLSHHDSAREHGKRALFHPYVLPGHKTKMFFRDDGLSDLIGFEYSKCNSVDAANELVSHLVKISDFLGDSANRHVVSIILDGENAWEYYPHNGFYFLDHLYQTLSEHKLLKTSTYANLGQQIKTHELEKICAGSWVYGSFSTWIGQVDKNRAWERLVEAKHAYDSVLHTDTLSSEEAATATKQLAICEGSDWFWWFGDVNSSESVRDFDQLFRLQLKNLYGLLKLDIPENLDESLSKGGGNAENSGTMVRNVS